LEKARRQAKAATTVTMPYGISADVRTSPRPKIARCMTSASIMPSTSSSDTVIVVRITVCRKSAHHRPLERTST
jgi:hypothetical protein